MPMSLDPAVIIGLLAAAAALLYGLWVLFKEARDGIRALREKRGRKDRTHLDAALDRMGKSMRDRNARMEAHKRDSKVAPF
jgi:hypothetical protein